MVSHPDDLVAVLKDPALHIERIGLDAGRNGRCQLGYCDAVARNKARVSVYLEISR